MALNLGVQAQLDAARADLAELRAASVEMEAHIDAIEAAHEGTPTGGAFAASLKQSLEDLARGFFNMAHGLGDLARQFAGKDGDRE